MKKKIELFLLMLMIAPALSLLYFLMTGESFSTDETKFLIAVVAGLSFFITLISIVFDEDKKKITR